MGGFGIDRYIIQFDFPPAFNQQEFILQAEPLLSPFALSFITQEKAPLAGCQELILQIKEAELLMSRTIQN